MVVTPYYNKPNQEGLRQHFTAIAKEGLPGIMYDVPGRTAVDISNDTVLRLAELDNIVGLKDATGDVARGADLVARCGDDFALYSGDDPTAMELMLSGGKGSISVTANVAPALVADMCRFAVRSGGHVRTGIGDNALFEGEILSNAEQISRVVQMAHRVEREIASPADVRTMWSRPPE